MTTLETGQLQVDMGLSWHCCKDSIHSMISLFQIWNQDRSDQGFLNCAAPLRLGVSALVFVLICIPKNSMYFIYIGFSVLFLSFLRTMWNIPKFLFLLSKKSIINYVSQNIFYVKIKIKTKLINNPPYNIAASNLNFKENIKKYILC